MLEVRASDTDVKPELAAGAQVPMLWVELAEEMVGAGLALILQSTR